MTGSQVRGVALRLGQSGLYKMELQIPPDPLQVDGLCDEFVAVLALSLSLSQVVSVKLTPQFLEAVFLPHLVLERFLLLS